MAQSCLEEKGIEAREYELSKSRYGFTPNDQYSANHPNALSDGDGLGKGVGNGGHGCILPDCSKATFDKTLGILVTSTDSSNFNTEEGGGLFDIEGRTKDGIEGGRERSIAMSKYNVNNQYPPKDLSTDKNESFGNLKQYPHS